MASQAVRDGVFAINKPCGPSSAQIVRECQTAFSPSAFFQPVIQAGIAKAQGSSGEQRKRPKVLKKWSQLKIGHGGTLDPLATGILIMGVGNGTKALSQFLECTKTYETTVVFGASTDTYDRVGRVLSRRPYDHITREKVEVALDNFRGKRTQIPPLYSALKMNGKPLYEYAREGKPIPREIQGREVTAFEVELLEWYEPKSHDHRWPTEEAEAAERNLAEQVWRVKKQQETGRTLTPEEKEVDSQAIQDHEAFKKKFEERQDSLIRDSPSKKVQHKKKAPAMMSGALGQLPQSGGNKGEAKKLVSDPPDPNTPPPWNDEGPPAVRIKLTVSGGYYIRSFCHDLGAQLGSAALMSELSRTRQSDFTAGGINCLDYEDLEKGEAVWAPKVANMLARWNGEPESTYRPPSPSSAAQGDKKGPADATGAGEGGSAAGESRKRSRSPRGDAETAPPRKVQAREKTDKTEKSAKSGDGSAPNRRRSDSGKSWQGIEG